MRVGLTRGLFILTLILIVVGLTMVFSSSAGEALRGLREEYHRKYGTYAGAPSGPIAFRTVKILSKQAVMTALGLIIMLICYRIDYDRFKKWAPWLLWGSFLSLLLVYIPGVGKQINGAHRWFGVGSLLVQPSEFAKLAVIIFLSKKLSERANILRFFWKGFVPLLSLVGLFIVAIFPEPDLGSCLVIAVIVFVMFVVAGARMQHLAGLALLGMVLAALAVAVEPYRVRRVLAFLNPEADPLNTGYQLFQSLISIGSGGLLGYGLGQGPQKYMYVSEMRTDFIFAAICEELGLVGALCVIVLYLLFVFQGYRIAARTTDLYACLLATGITTMVGAQAFIHMAVVTGLAPTKGLTLPLISWGGSSMVMNLAAIGILMSVARVVEQEIITLPPSRGAVPRLQHA